MQPVVWKIDYFERIEENTWSSGLNESPSEKLTLNLENHFPEQTAGAEWPVNMKCGDDGGDRSECEMRSCKHCSGIKLLS